MPQLNAKDFSPRKTGIGLRSPHFEEILETKPNIGFLEAHSENYFSDGGAPVHYLQELSKHYPISLHGVGMSLGTVGALDEDHLTLLQQLVDSVSPVFISEHISWNAFAGKHVPDLIPLPYTKESLDILCKHVDQVQQKIGQQILMENASSYLQFKGSQYTEPDYLNKLVQRTGCGLLLDINNIYVSSRNLGFDAKEYINGINPYAVKEHHLAGFSVNRVDGKDILIDTHSRRVTQDVWDLYEYSVQQFGDVAALIEWDKDIPELSVLLEEAEKADAIRSAILGEDQNDARIA